MRRVLMTLTVLSLAACGNPVKKLCKEQAECDPDYDEATCMDDYEDLQEAADELGCADVLDDFVKCSAKEGGECTDGYYEVDGCTGEAFAYIGCFFGDSTWTFSYSSTSDTGY